MQRNIEKGNVQTISITDMTVNKKAHSPEELEPLSVHMEKRSINKLQAAKKANFWCIGLGSANINGLLAMAMGRASGSQTRDPVRLGVEKYFLLSDTNLVDCHFQTRELYVLCYCRLLSTSFRFFCFHFFFFFFFFGAFLRFACLGSL